MSRAGSLLEPWGMSASILPKTPSTLASRDARAPRASRGSRASGGPRNQVRVSDHLGAAFLFFGSLLLLALVVVGVAVALRGGVDVVSSFLDQR